MIICDKINDQKLINKIEELLKKAITSENSSNEDNQLPILNNSIKCMNFVSGEITLLNL